MKLSPGDIMVKGIWLGKPKYVDMEMVMEREKFEEFVVKALNELPAEFQDRLENIDVIVQDYPTQGQLAKLGHGMTLLGLYEGVPHIGRTQVYGMVLPDKITIFQKTIEAKCHTEKDIMIEIRRVVYHEIAHHFGLDDKLLKKIETDKMRRKEY